jgi:hypothetical protein
MMENIHSEGRECDGKIELKSILTENGSRLCPALVMTLAVLNLEDLLSEWQATVRG